MRRRSLLATVGGFSAGVPLLSLPTFERRATLDAAVSVRHWAVDETGDIGVLAVEVRNTRPPQGDPLTPVVNVWGIGRQTQIAWPPARGHYPTLNPGEAGTLELHAPGDQASVRLVPNKRALARVYDQGTERRTHTTFVPRVGGGEGAGE